MDAEPRRDQHARRDYGWATCVECDNDSERLLHAGFPHICSRCLFPPAKASDDSRGVEELPELVQRLSPVARLAAIRGNGRWRGTLDSFHIDGMPEKYNRGRREGGS